MGGESAAAINIHPTGGELLKPAKGYSRGDELIQLSSENTESIKPFSPQLSWSHYRALMRVADEETRAFYEQEPLKMVFPSPLPYFS